MRHLAMRCAKNLNWNKRGTAATGLEMERVMGIEPTLFAWEAKVLPLNYTRLDLEIPDALALKKAPVKHWIDGRPIFRNRDILTPRNLLQKNWCTAFLVLFCRPHHYALLLRAATNATSNQCSSACRGGFAYRHRGPTSSQPPPACQ